MSFFIEYRICKTRTVYEYRKILHIPQNSPFATKLRNYLYSRRNVRTNHSTEKTVEIIKNAVTKRKHLRIVFAGCEQKIYWGKAGWPLERSPVLIFTFFRHSIEVSSQLFLLLFILQFFFIIFCFFLFCFLYLYLLHFIRFLHSFLLIHSPSESFFFTTHHTIASTVATCLNRVNSL